MTSTEHEHEHERRRRLPGWAAVGLAAAVAAVALGACAGKHEYTKYDRQANEESLECARPPDLSPPAGRYEDRGVELDWDRLVNPRDPMSHDIDMGYVEAVIEDPDKLEQVYYEATHGHARASFLACQYEVGARVMGRNVARFVSSFKCTSVVTCEVHVDELPISDETGSGQRGRVPRADHAAHEQRGLRGRRGPVRRLPPGRADRSKGPGYAKFIKDGKFRGFFHGQQKLLEQAERQLRAARGTPIEWHLAEASFVQALRRYLAREQITGIRVIHTP